MPPSHPRLRKIYYIFCIAVPAAILIDYGVLNTIQCTVYGELIHKALYIASFAGSGVLALFSVIEFFVSIMDKSGKHVLLAVLTFALSILALTWEFALLPIYFFSSFCTAINESLKAM